MTLLKMTLIRWGVSIYTESVGNEVIQLSMSKLSRMRLWLYCVSAEWDSAYTKSTVFEQTLFSLSQPTDRLRFNVCTLSARSETMLNHCWCCVSAMIENLYICANRIIKIDENLPSCPLLDFFPMNMVLFEGVVWCIYCPLLSDRSNKV